MTTNRLALEVEADVVRGSPEAAGSHSAKAIRAGLRPEGRMIGFASWPPLPNTLSRVLSKRLNPMNVQVSIRASTLRLVPS